MRIDPGGIDIYGRHFRTVGGPCALKSIRYGNCPAGSNSTKRPVPVCCSITIQALNSAAMSNGSACQQRGNSDYETKLYVGDST
jgi:hypothetical protein